MPECLLIIKLEIVPILPLPNSWYQDYQQKSKAIKLATNVSHQNPGY